MTAKNLHVAAVFVFNPFKPNGISVLRDIGWYFSFLFKF